MIGKTISHYRITEKLGEGGMGVVYKAQDLRLPRFVALKFLPPHLSTDEIAKRRFIHEAEAASALDHPNIGTIYEIDQTDDGQMFIAMACYEGQTLKQKIAEGPVSVGEALDLTAQIASGLAKAHEGGILHRDIKPGNILLTEDGHAKIVDFGLAKLAGQTRVTRTGTTLGTVSYMSPEQASGEEADSRSDVFSAGVVLYELLTGKLPFRGDHEAAVIYSIVNREPASLDSYRDDLPADAQRVIDKALTKDRDDRYRSATELLADLWELQEGRQVAAFQKETRRSVYTRALLYASIGLVVVAAGYLTLTRLDLSPEPEPPEATGPIATEAIAVLPFTVHGSDDFLDMGTGMVDLLSTKLDGAGALGAVESRSLLSFVEQKGRGQVNPALGREVAREFDAKFFLLGDIMVVGERLNISAALYEASGGSQLVAAAKVEGEADQLLSLVDDLALQLLKDWLKATGDFRFDFESITTRSFPALKAFLEGERWFRSRHENHLGMSIDAFQHAVEADSTFALAWYRLAVAVWWPMLDIERAREAVNQAYRYSGGLPEQERLRIRALQAHLYEKEDEAEQLYRTMVGNDPEDVEAWHALGVVQLFSYARLGRDVMESREAFERAFALDPEGWQARFHLGAFVLKERQYDKLRTLQARDDGEFPLYVRAILAFGDGDEAAQEGMLAELAEQNDHYLLICVLNIADFTDDFLRAQDAVRLLSESHRSDEVRGFGHIILAYLEAARGRWRAARLELDTAETLNHPLTMEYSGLLAASPFLPVAEAELQALRDALVQWDAEAVAASANPAPWLGVHDEAHPHLRVYLIGILSARLGDYDRALACADDLGRMSGPPHVIDLMSYFAHGLRAQVVWKQGSPEEGYEEFRKMRMRLPSQYRLYSAFYKQKRERYLRAELLHEMGRHEEALGWTSSFGYSWNMDFIYRAPLHLRRAEHYERVGQSAHAAEHYGRFIEIWQDCDVELRPLVEETRKKLSVLTSKEE